jgi:hypothetical protein
MAISFVKSDKMIEAEKDQKLCEVVVGAETFEGKFERCPKTGDIRVCCEETESGFGESKDIPRNQPTTVHFKDGSGSEYSGQIDDNGKLIR